MDFQEVVQRRRMVRTFTGDPIPRRALDRILANAVRGPSAGFSQGQAFLVLTGDDLPKFWAVAGEAVAESAVIPYIGSRDHSTREEAVSILKEIGTRKSLNALNAARGDPDPKVAAAAKEAFDAVKNR